MTMLRWIFRVLLSLAAYSSPALAELVELVMPNKLTAKAEFHKGDPAKPTVLLVHGFLQTYEFPTIYRLTEGLASAGYSVLAPTLTLGVTHRKQSLACEAIHTHTIQDGAKELAVWVDWLKARKASAIVLVGHSFGSVETLSYLSAYREPLVRKLIGVSAVEGRLKVDGPRRGKVIKETRALLKAHNKSLITEQFSFCQKYRATPESMLSYLEWTPDRIITEASRLPMPATFIMGSRDDRLGANWIERLRQTKAKVRVIEGANHFMDGDFEFDLLDTVLLELKAL
jgi:pimeloyl-ACP methyl ester carboxylesterase